MRLQQFLHQEVRRAQPVLIPYHLPTTRPLEAPPTKVIKLLWSNVKELPTPASTCSCKHFLKKHCKANNLDGHVVTGLETLTLPSSMQHFQDMSGANAYYDNKTKFLENSMQTMDRWMQHHQCQYPVYLGTKQQFRQFLEDQWQQHSQSLRRNPRYTVGGIKCLKSFIPTILWYTMKITPEPHHDLLLSSFFNQAAINSWADPGVFTELSDSPEQLKIQMKNNLPKSLSKQQQQQQPNNNNSWWISRKTFHMATS